MKHFYNLFSTANPQQSAPLAFGTAISDKIFKMLLVGIILLISRQGMAQTPAGSIFYSHQNGDWDKISTWSLKSNNLDAPTRLPDATDIVEVTSGTIVTIPAGTFSCTTLKIHAGGGNPKIGGELIIGTGESTTAKLTTNNLFFTRATGQPKERATLRMGAKGHITIGDKVNIVGNNDALVTNPINTDIFYSFNANSIIEYGGGDQTLFNFSVVSVGDETSTSYPNLILSGSGVKTVSSDKEVRGNFTVNGTASFSSGSFSHTVNGNLNVSSVGASITGNSTVSGLGLTVGGNVINSGNITFQNRVLSVGGNFTNNTGGLFTAGLGTHTISGNWTNDGTFSAGSGTITLNGLSKTISSIGTGAFNNLTISDGGTGLLSNIIVNGSLALSNAILNTGTNKVILGNTATISGGESATQNITGTVETTRSVATGADQTFGGIGFVVTNSNADFGQVTVTRTTGASHIERNEQSARRQYTVSSTSGTGVSGTSVAMRFPTYDLNTPIENLYDLYKFVDQNVSRLAANVPYDPVSITTSSDLRGMYTLYSSSITPLPVELISFNAQRHTQGVSLTWVTASELDNKGFEVQVSTDSRNFTAIGFVESKVGTTSLKQHYNFLDTKALSGTRYYRLKQIDFDGQFEYSAIKSVTLDGDNGVAAAYPNPFDDVVTVKLTGTEVRRVKATLTDAMGKVILETTEETAGNSISVNMTRLTTKGLYVLHVLDNGTKHTFKLMKR